MQCRSHAAQLGHLYQEFTAADCEILLVLGNPLDKAKSYSEIFSLPFPVLSDPQRMVYHQYGLEKELIFLQRTASIIVDKEGIIRYIKTATNPMLWLQESRQLLDFVESMSSANG
jgi:peroxiredoxin